MIMRNRSKLYLAIFMLGAMPAAGLAQDTGDPANGEKLARKCMICHQIGDSRKVSTGPNLTNVIGRQAGTAEGYRPSKMSKAAGDAGLVWTEDLIVQYLPNPKKFIMDYLVQAGKPDEAKGSYKMPVSFKNEQENRDIAAYLKSLAEK
jgi:cytochrome c